MFVLKKGETMPKIIEEQQLDFKDVLIKPRIGNVNSRKEVDLRVEIDFKHSDNKWVGVPIIAANMDTVATMDMANHLATYQCMTALHKHYDDKELVNFFKRDKSKKGIEQLKQNSHHLEHVFYSMGIREQDYEKFEKVLDRVGYWGEHEDPSQDGGIRFVCIDVANGYMSDFANFCQFFKSKHPSITLMAGNVVSADIVRILDSVGVDMVKVGIGPGSVCTTRKIAGVGRPQLSTIIDCAEEANRCGIHIVSDGGCTVPGDVAKAFAAGASFVMLGGMLAGHEEIGLKKIIDDDGKEFFEFYGMSSGDAMGKHSGGVAGYRAEEGKRVLIPSRGPLDFTMQSILGGVRSACTYVGATSLPELQANAQFYKTNIQTNDVFGKS